MGVGLEISTAAITGMDAVAGNAMPLAIESGKFLMKLDNFFMVTADWGRKSTIARRENNFTCNNHWVCFDNILKPESRPSPELAITDGGAVNSLYDLIHTNIDIARPRYP